MSQLSTIAVLLVLAAIVAAIIVSLNNDRKSGISSCGGSC
ncbi:MAG: FeoB-associated Cys-rich membrane protein, partial [Oscillospiraceae bacterium]|nr:FeoB-associated Cys-rich membrane protein [Oscillospiraceae bacterium]